MIGKLRHLVAEVDAAIDIYLAGRTGQQFNRVAYILADDCCELASKLYLLTRDPNWSDQTANGFRTFKAVTQQVRNAFPAANGILDRIVARRDRRNGFFHSAHLLDLNLHARDVKEALLDVLDYGEMLFGANWNEHVAATGSLETTQLLLRLDCLAHTDPRIPGKVSAVFANLKGGGKAAAKAKGCEIAHHPDDHHLRLAIRNGGPELRAKLAALLD